MLPRPTNYSIYPSVLPASKPVEMTIVSNERAFLFVENESYELTMIQVNGDEENIHEPTLVFEDKWRLRQINGPLTKGGRVDSDTVTRQI